MSRARPAVTPMSAPVTIQIGRAAQPRRHPLLRYTTDLAGEVTAMEERWSDLLHTEPAHSLNLAPHDDGFTPAAEPRVALPWRD